MLFLLRVSKTYQHVSKSKSENHRNEMLSNPPLFNPGAQLLQDYQAANGPKESKEEAAVTELPVLPVHPGVCV